MVTTNDEEVRTPFVFFNVSEHYDDLNTSNHTF